MPASCAPVRSSARRSSKTKVLRPTPAAAAAASTVVGMGNRCCCCAGGWNCPSPFKRKKEKPAVSATGSRISKPTPQHSEIKKVNPFQETGPSCAREYSTSALTEFDAAPVYDDVSDFPVYATVSKPKHLRCDNSSVHYADIQVFSKSRERSAEEVKSIQTQNATEYATLNFPRAAMKYDSKNGTLV